MLNGLPIILQKVVLNGLLVILQRSRANDPKKVFALAAFVFGFAMEPAILLDFAMELCNVIGQDLKKVFAPPALCLCASHI